MAFTIFDVGFLEWFDVRSNGSGTLSQAIGSGLAKIPPCYAVKNSGWNPGGDCFVKKTLPEATNELWASFVYNWSYNWTSTAESGTGAVLAIETASGTKIASIRQCGYGMPKSGLGQVYVGETYVTDIGLPQSACTQFEVRCRVGETTGLFQIWADGTLVFDWTGNTGTAAIARVGHYNAARVDGYLSMFVYSNEGRIGGKQPVVCALTGPGEVSDASYTNFIGNLILGNGTSNLLTGTKTLTAEITFPEAGTIKEIRTYLYGAGTYKVGIVSVNSGDAAKRTVKYVSNVLNGAAGAITLVAGVDIPGNWLVAPGDSIAICAITATLSGNYGYATSVKGDGWTSDCGTYAGDGLNISDQTEKTYSWLRMDALTKSVTFRLAAVYQATATSAFKVSSDETNLYAQAVSEACRYFEQTAEDQTNYFTIKPLPIACVYVKTVKFTIRGTGGAVLTSADFLLKSGDTEYSVRNALPTSTALGEAYLTGAWTPAAYNAAQFGIRAKP